MVLEKVFGLSCFYDHAGKYFGNAKVLGHHLDNGE